MLRTTLAGLRAHKLRLLLTATAIMIGVGFLAGTLVYGDTAKAAFYDDLARAAKNVDASVGSSGFSETGQRFDAGIVEEIKAVPGVAHADGRMAERLPMLDGKGRLISYLGRIGWALSTPGDEHLSMYDIGTGRSRNAPARSRSTTPPPGSTASRSASRSPSSAPTRSPSRCGWSASWTWGQQAVRGLHRRRARPPGHAHAHRRRRLRPGRGVRTARRLAAASWPTGSSRTSAGGPG